MIEADTLYFRGKDERTQAINLEPYSTDVVYNVWAGSNDIAQVNCNSGSYSYYYYLKDHLGNVRMTLNSGGGIDAYNNYYPFGEQLPGLNGTGSSDGRYKYVSVEQDPETSLYYMHARYYDPWSGRFFEVDPMANDSTLAPWSPYQYSFDNPVRFKDPTGKWPGFLDNFVSDVTNWIRNQWVAAQNSEIAASGYQNPDQAQAQAQSDYANSDPGLPTKSKVEKVQFQVASDFMYATMKGEVMATGETLSLAATAGAFEEAPLALTGGITLAKTAVNTASNIMSGKSALVPVAEGAVDLALPYTPFKGFAKGFSTITTLYGYYDMYHQ